MTVPRGISCALFAAAFALSSAASPLIEEGRRLLAADRLIDAYLAFRRAEETAADSAARRAAREAIEALHRRAEEIRASRAEKSAESEPAPGISPGPETRPEAEPEPATVPEPHPAPPPAPSLPSPAQALRARIEEAIERARERGNDGEVVRYRLLLDRIAPEASFRRPSGSLANLALSAPALRGNPTATKASAAAPKASAAAALEAGASRDWLGALRNASVALQYGVDPADDEWKVLGVAAQAAFHLGLYDEALNYLVRAEAAAPPQAAPALRFDRALVLRRENRFQEALSTLSSVPPDLPGRRLLEANLLADLAQPEAALTRLAPLLEHDPAASLNYGQILLEMGRAEDAAAHLARLYEAWPSDLVRFARARALAAGGDREGAIREYLEIERRGDADMAALARQARRRLEAMEDLGLSEGQ